MWATNGILAGDPPRPIAAYEYIRELLEQDNLKISEKKTGFVVSHTAERRLLQERLPANGPQAHERPRSGLHCRAVEPHHDHEEPSRKGSTEDQKADKLEDSSEKHAPEAVQKGASWQESVGGMKPWA